ncbi:MAG: arginine--tRNA ligase, partial [Bacteroidia bacterium]|nr:arginine--tRNA ligase [Bacteroidia bacterium]
VVEAGNRMSPAVIANYLYELAKTFNQFYQECPIVDEGNAEQSAFRMQLAEQCAKIIKSGMDLLGINVPDRM